MSDFSQEQAGSDSSEIPASRSAAHSSHFFVGYALGMLTALAGALIAWGPA